MFWEDRVYKGQLKNPTCCSNTGQVWDVACRRPLPRVGGLAALSLWTWVIPRLKPKFKNPKGLPFLMGFCIKFQDSVIFSIILSCFLKFKVVEKFSP